MVEQIERLIKETEAWRIYHRQNGNQIEVAACAIRLIALKECLEIVKKNLKST
jgi:glycerol dehydrogenase-like iron-containing ADH family enzyme